MPKPLDDARYELALANRIIAHEGVLDGFGHVSMRHPTDPGRYIARQNRGPATRREPARAPHVLDHERMHAR